MARVRNVALIATLAGALALPAAASADTATSMVAAVNQFRHAHGLSSVRVSRSLEHSAHAYAASMLATGYFGHASTIHASRQFRTLGEVLEVHRGGSPAVGFTLRDWENSPPHRAILLSPVFSFAGAGYVVGNFQGRRQTLWVMHLGRH